MTTHYRTVDVDGTSIFYREAGEADAPALLLLHGFPSASHMFRDLLPLLAKKFRLIAPDLPGFGQSAQPPRGQFVYSFDNLAHIIDRFTDVIGLNTYALYVFDYGAPVGLRLAVKHPDRITGIITQNGNAYLEGVSAAFDPIQAYWKDPSQANRDALRGFLAPQTTLFQYTQGVPDISVVSPDGRELDDHYLARAENAEIQLDLILDYQTNVAAYGTFQEYFRTHQPRLLAIWGKNDPFFLPAGAEAFRRDLPNADIRLLDTGHFALETHAVEIAQAIDGFLAPAPSADANVFADLTAATAPSQAQPLLAATAGIFGFVPNLAVKMAADPAALEGYLSGLQAFGNTQALSPVEQQIVLITASIANGAAYSVAVHATVAAKLGASAALVQAVSAGAIPAEKRLAALQRFTKVVSEDRGHVPAAEIARFTTAGYDRAAIVAVAMGVALKSFANSVALIADPAIDDGFKAHAV